jgi:hypothetical protein
MGSVSEFIRQAVVAQLAWDRALRVVQAGADAATLDDVDRLAKLLAEIASRK